MHMRKSLSRVSPAAVAVLPMLISLAVMLLPCAVHAQETQSVRSDIQQNADASEKASCPPVRKTQFPMRNGDLSITHISGAIVFEAGMAIDADGAPNAYGPHDRGLDRLANARHGNRWVGIATNQRGKPLIQKKGRYRGYYVSTTSLQDSTIRNPANPAKYVSATKIPYIVLPPEVAERFGIALGDLAVVINQRNEQPVVAFAIYADSGPRGKIGEGSIALAEALGLPADPRTGKTEDGVLYVVFPGSGLGPGRLRKLKEITSATAELYEQWGGPQSLQACSLLRGPSFQKSGIPVSISSGGR